MYSSVLHYSVRSPGEVEHVLKAGQYLGRHTPAPTADLVAQWYIVEVITSKVVARFRYWNEAGRYYTHSHINVLVSWKW